MRKLIARRGNQELYDIGNGNGFIYDRDADVEFEPHSLDSILSRGYWEPIAGIEIKTSERGGVQKGVEGEGKMTTKPKIYYDTFDAKNPPVYPEEPEPTPEEMAAAKAIADEVKDGAGTPGHSG